MERVWKVQTKIVHPYVQISSKVCNGSPVIAGTRIRIVDIAVEYEYMNCTPDDIISAHPHMKLEEVHDYLSYYYENQSWNWQKNKRRRGIHPKTPPSSILRAIGIGVFSWLTWVFSWGLNYYGKNSSWKYKDWIWRVDFNVCKLWKLLFLSCEYFFFAIVDEN